ncbi:predicted protein [Sclerotinia sclerotiorum 1980 UF-70]|uniref:Uncharacterized protein n=1 Tax=Sclerotinia sclerotiorum (strain ATCC 18683 / 1980 / Ss-1) TaxID=665079 RepID=A7F5L8_SCLS1|nr:predicted protein [Sclerotinia sclerotiorum 1980 UF-70]EDN98039.1 predicted protein [Sclerotinia sclerotiorum 1980 UF-70]
MAKDTIQDAVLVTRAWESRIFGSMHFVSFKMNGMIISEDEYNWPWIKRDWILISRGTDYFSIVYCTTPLLKLSGNAEHFVCGMTSSRIILREGLIRISHRLVAISGLARIYSDMIQNPAYVARGSSWIGVG